MCVCTVCIFLFSAGSCSIILCSVRHPSPGMLGSTPKRCWAEPSMASVNVWWTYVLASQIGRS